MNILTVLRWHKRFGDQVTIADLSFSIPQGGRAAIFAPSGSGKTTLLQILARLQQPDGGSFWLEDPRPVVIFQEPRLFPHLTVEENIFLPFRVQKKPLTAQIQQDYKAWLRVCELGAFRQHFPHQLSGGMKQKVALVRGFLQKPTFVMLDEPFQSIGQQAKKGIIQHLLATNPGLSMLLVTHDPEEARLMADFTFYFSTNYLGQYSLIEAPQTIFAL
ncbi:MAG: ATP-binding cassette domain-containing protein [Chloroflexi bacterium]|nr:MAG: ATP-binding cassette domain-containing protein [Chloroflexota bacterium]